MFNKQKIKKLAYIASGEKKISKEIAKFVLENLKKQDLKLFLFYYKAFLSKRKVYVTTADKLSSEITSKIQKDYPGCDVIVLLDKSLGAGIRLQHDDIIIDFTVKKYINDTIEQLTN